MLIRFSLVTLLAASGFAVATPSFAQTSSQIDIEAAEVIPKPVKKRRIVRNVEPVAYWVESDKLRVRNNPVAGDVVGMLELGQKIKSYQIFENWVRISPKNKSEQWVNSEFISNQQVTYANFNSGRRTARKGFVTNGAPDDVNLKRIKAKNYDGGRVFAASVKQTSSDARIVVTKTEFRAGPYFEKRRISCDGKAATHAQLIGEGYTYLMMEYDKRSEAIISNPDQSTHALSDETSPMTSAIANYACKTDP